MENNAPVCVVTFARRGGGRAKFICNEVSASEAVAKAFEHYNASWETVEDVKVGGITLSREGCA